jgi:SAM-dependent methyltransferase
MATSDKKYQDTQRSELSWWQHNKINVELLWSRHVLAFGQHFPERHQLGIVADVGSGPIPIFCDESIHFTKAIAIDPLYEDYVAIPHYTDITLEVYWMQDIKQADSSYFDNVFALNMLDHCQLPDNMLLELIRILKPNGHLFLFVDIDKPPDTLHPHSISEQWLRDGLSSLEMVMVKIEKSWKFKNYVMWYVGAKP